jgi:nucleoside-diphosphate-sugar epimerase
MKVLVTGGTGFLGRRLVDQLLDTGAHVRCLARRGGDLVSHFASDADRSNRLEIREGSLTKLGAGSDVAEGCDVVYHLAAELRGGTASMFLTNVVSTRGLVAACARVGVGRFVLVSSLGVYGTGGLRPGDVLDERCPLDPEPHRRDPYSYSKVSQEQVVWEAHQSERLPVVVVRPGVIYGPGREAVTSRVGLRLGEFVLQMGGRHVLPYTFVDNCAEAILRAGAVPGIEGEAFNIVDDELPVGRQILKLHRRSVGQIRSITVPRPAIHMISSLCEWYHQYSRGQIPAVLTRYKSDAQWKRLNYSNQKAKLSLAWAPRVGLDEGLRETFGWLRREADRRRESARGA